MKKFKEFRVAQIVPACCLELTKDNQYHMCLANIAARNKTYADFYKRMVSEGKYVLMDNGAAEGEQLSTASLISMYEYINPTEIVVPDTLCDGPDTLRKAVEFIAKYPDLPYKLMFVPQGKTFEEWCNNAKALLLSFENANSVGVSKFLNIATDDPMIRYAAAGFIEEFNATHNRNVEVHLLGCDEGPAIVRDIQLEYPSVRGCDSAFAYIAAQAGTHIDDTTTRPVGEIDFINGPYVEGLEDVLDEMADTAGVVYNGLHPSWDV